MQRMAYEAISRLGHTLGRLERAAIYSGVQQTLRLATRHPLSAAHATELPALHPNEAHLVLGAVFAALPCGYGFGIVAAYLLAGGSQVGHIPLLTVPLALLVSAVSALAPVFEAQTRFLAMGVGAIAATVLLVMIRLAFP
jgi:hypothetical protein